MYEWGPLPDVACYRLFISDEPDLDKQGEGTSRVTAYGPCFAGPEGWVEDGRTWYWTVEACDEDGNVLAESEVGSFTPAPEDLGHYYVDVHLEADGSLALRAP